jgi:pyridoxamine 5'-phosphate oxidase
MTDSEEFAEPIARFAAWLAEAEESEPNDPNAVALATATADGRPSVRMVLLKGVDPAEQGGGFVFYTNLGSRKAAELTDNPHAALCFHWKSLRRQVRVEGPVTPVDDGEADAYFATRHRSSRIGAYASKQSQPLEGRWELEKRVAKFTAKFPVGEIPRPEFWSGFRIKPQAIEFWEDRPFRLHDRVVYHATDGGWTTQRIFP